MSDAAKRRAEELTRYADTVDDDWHLGHYVSWDDIADAYLVAADAWLEVDDRQEAAHRLLQAAEYRRWALDEREDLVPGGIRHSINWSTGEGAMRLPILSLSEAAAIASLAGWLDTYSDGVRKGLTRHDNHGRPNRERLE